MSLKVGDLVYVAYNQGLEDYGIGTVREHLVDRAGRAVLRIDWDSLSPGCYRYLDHEVREPTQAEMEQYTLKVLSK